MKVQDKLGSYYQQIADFSIDQVLSGAWADGEQIPSVRQLAADAGVTPNTVMHAFSHLKDMAIIETQRGKGLFVTANGRATAVAMRRKHFIETEIPKLQRNLDLLNISLEELTELLNPQPTNLN